VHSDSADAISPSLALPGGFCPSQKPWPWFKKHKQQQNSAKYSQTSEIKSNKISFGALVLLQHSIMTRV
jgi:hypothetical protein